MWSYLWKYIHIVLKSIYILKKDVVGVVVDIFGVVAVVAVNVFVIVVIYYNDVIMGEIASQITSLTIVYSIVYSDADQRKPQSSASLAFARGIHRGPVNSPHKWPVTRKMFPFDDVIMETSTPGTHNTKDLWARNWNPVKIPVALLLVLKIPYGYNFAHARTAELSWHVQNCDQIGSFFPRMRNNWVLVLKPEYSGLTTSTPWLLMARLLASPAHQQSCHLLCKNSQLPPPSQCGDIIESAYVYSFIYLKNVSWKYSVIMG